MPAKDTTPNTTETVAPYPGQICNGANVWLPLNAALTIVGAGDDDKAVQAALQDAYESGTLRGKQLLQARRVIERRQSLGRTVARGTPRKREGVTTSSLIRTYQKEVERQRQMVKKAEFAQQRLIFVVSGLHRNYTNFSVRNNATFVYTGNYIHRLTRPRKYR